MNFLTLVPAKVRLALYVAYGVAALVVTNTGVYFTAVHAQIPAWVLGAAAVLGSLAAPFGALASSNVTKSSDVHATTTDAATPDIPVVP